MSKSDDHVTIIYANMQHKILWNVNINRSQVYINLFSLHFHIFMLRGDIIKVHMKRSSDQIKIHTGMSLINNSVEQSGFLKGRQYEMTNHPRILAKFLVHTYLLRKKYMMYKRIKNVYYTYNVYHNPSVSAILDRHKYM